MGTGSSAGPMKVNSRTWVWVRPESSPGMGAMTQWPWASFWPVRAPSTSVPPERTYSSSSWARWGVRISWWGQNSTG